MSMAVIHVAGTVRDAGAGLAARLASMEHALEDLTGDLPRFHLYENDSKDRTREELLRFQTGRSNTIVHLEDGLVERIPRREERIAFCRNALLDSIRAQATDADPSKETFYLPVDLDLPVDWHGAAEGLREAMMLLSSNAYDGVFPASSPRYYDIHALRAAYWNRRDAWASLGEYRSKPLGRHIPEWLLRSVHIYARQFDASTLALVDEPIDVDSAFGGFGIYRMEALGNRRYEISRSDACEHVNFNRGLRLAILPTLSISAPPEHLGSEASWPNHRRAVVRAVRHMRASQWRRRRSGVRADG